MIYNDWNPIIFDKLWHWNINQVVKNDKVSIINDAKFEAKQKAWVKYAW